MRADGAAPPPYDLREKYSDERIVTRYDLRYADFQGRWTDRATWRALRRALAPDPLAGALILDLPCGTGRLLERLQAARPSGVVGVDLSWKMLLAARRRHGPRAGVLNICADGLRPPFRPGCFDLAIVLRFLHLLGREERIRFLEATAGHVRGPILAVYYPNHTIKALTRAARRHLGMRVPERSRWIPWSTIHEEIRASGLQCTRRVAVFPWLASGVVLRLEKRPAKTR